jgi:hypothetical protein
LVTGVPKTTPVAAHVAFAAAETAVGAVIVGAILSKTITVWIAVELFAFASVNVQVIVCVPCVEYVNGFVVVPFIVPEQLSCVVGAVAVAEQTPVIEGKTGTFGATLSVTVTVKLHVLVLLEASVAVYVTVVVPVEN